MYVYAEACSTTPMKMLLKQYVSLRMKPIADIWLQKGTDTVSGIEKPSRHISTHECGINRRIETENIIMHSRTLYIGKNIYAMLTEYFTDHSVLFVITDWSVNV